MDQILIRCLLDDAQGKLAQISGLQGESLLTPPSFSGDRHWMYTPTAIA